MGALDLNTGPDLPPKTDYGIGCIGAGFIMKDIHLVAYAEAGFNVVAIASRTPANAQAAADERGVETVYDTWQELLDDERVEILDIAYPPDQQLGIIREAVKRPHIKGILAQKPVAFTLDEAVEMVRLCDEAGIKLGVNHNMRYDQSMRALRSLLDAGAARRADRRRDRDERPATLAGVPAGLRPDRVAQHVDPPPRRLPLPVRRPRADLRVGPERPEPGLPAQGRERVLHPRVRQRAAGDRPRQLLHVGRPQHPVAGRGDRGDREGHDRLARLPGRQPLDDHLDDAGDGRKLGAPHAGTTSGSPRRSRARWASSCGRSRRTRSRRSRGGRRSARWCWSRPRTARPTRAGRCR